MSFTSVLVDGTFRNPFVIFCVVFTAALLLAAAAALLRFAFLPSSSPRTKTPLLVIVCAGLVLASPVVFNVVVSALASVRARAAIGLCLMPTFMPVRDFAPGVIAAAGSIWLVGRRRRRSGAAA